jgi:prepilin-type N-terminal cleavage/methylation domain-containing protein
MISVLSNNIKRKGFTLIELIIAMAIFLIIIVMAFSTLSSYFAVRSANDQEMILQQNFRAALDKITYDFIQASSTPVISSPLSNSVKDTLTFTGADGDEISYTLVDKGGGTSAICRNGDPVTENVHQLVKLYFVRSGGKIIMIIIGDLTYFGKERTISFASMVFSRNANYEGQSP